MSKILIAIPCLFNAIRTEEAIYSVVNVPDTTVLLIDNGAEDEVKLIIEHFKTYDNVIVHHNKVNIFVNPVWNFAIDFFLKLEFEHLIIMNSDLVLMADWRKIIDNFIAIDSNHSGLPIITQDKNLLHPTDKEYKNLTLREIPGGNPGVFILISREMAKLVYPIPEEILIWFGDNWIYDIIRAKSKTFIIDEFVAYHYWSTNIQKVEGITEMIAKDTEVWEKDIKYRLVEKIKEL